MKTVKLYLNTEKELFLPAFDRLGKVDERWQISFIETYYENLMIKDGFVIVEYKGNTITYNCDIVSTIYTQGTTT